MEGKGRSLNPIRAPGTGNSRFTDGFDELDIAGDIENDLVKPLLAADQEEQLYPGAADKKSRKSKLRVNTYKNVSRTLSADPTIPIQFQLWSSAVDWELERRYTQSGSPPEDYSRQVLPTVFDLTDDSNGAFGLGIDPQVRSGFATPIMHSQAGISRLHSPAKSPGRFTSPKQYGAAFVSYTDDTHGNGGNSKKINSNSIALGKLPLERSSSLTNILLGKDHRSKSSKDREPPQQQQQKMDEHLLDLDVLEILYSTSLEHGLPAHLVQQRFKQNGPNVISGPLKKSARERILRQLFLGFNPLLFMAAAMYIWAWKHTNELPFLIVCIVLIGANTFTALTLFWHQRKATKLSKNIMQLMPTHCMVLRDSAWYWLDTNKIVVGDVVHVEVGVKVPADIRVVNVEEAVLDKSALTGSDLPITLTPNYTDYNHFETRNIAYFGTHLISGMFTGIVIRTGTNTVMGKITEISTAPDRHIGKMHQEFSHFISAISFYGFIMAALVTVDYFLRDTGNVEFAHILANALTLVVACIPEGLPIAVSIAHSIVMRNLSKANVIIKELEVSNTLGYISTIVTDKTGSLTESKIGVSKLVLTATKIPDYEVAVDDLDDFFLGHPSELVTLSHAAALNSRANFVDDIEEYDEALNPIEGNEVDAALFRFALQNYSLRLHRSYKKSVLVGEVPFNQRNRWQLTVHRYSDHFLVVVKGSPELILEFCSTAVIAVKSPNGKVGTEEVPLDLEVIERILSGCDQLGSKGEKVIACCQKELSFATYPRDLVFTEDFMSWIKEDMKYMGLISFTEPPKSNVSNAIKVCRGAGIRVMMVTGDLPSTAEAFAKKIGIITVSDVRYIKNGDNSREQVEDLAIPEDSAEQPALVITADNLVTFNDEHWAKILAHNQIVFANAKSAHKLIVTERCQRAGERVAVTGRNMNDAPSMKEADVGIAMGWGGCEVIKEAADVILVDNNFSSIVNAISISRLLFENMRKIICYFLAGGCFGQVLPTLMCIFFGLPLPLSPFLMLVISMITDIVGSIALAYEKPEYNLMSRKPRTSKADVLVNLKLFKYAFVQVGIIQCSISFLMYFIAMWQYSEGQVLPADLLFSFGHFAYKHRSVDPVSGEGVFGLMRFLFPLDVPYCNSLDCLVHHGQSAYFTSMVICQMWNMVGGARLRHIPAYKSKMNWKLIYALCINMIIIQVVTNVPWVNLFFHTGPLTQVYVYVPLVLGCFPFIVSEVVRACLLGRSKFIDKIFGY